MQFNSTTQALEVMDAVSHYLKTVKIDDFLRALESFKKTHDRNPKRPPIWLSSSIQPVDK